MCQILIAQVSCDLVYKISVIMIKLNQIYIYATPTILFK